MEEKCKFRTKENKCQIEEIEIEFCTDEIHDNCFHCKDIENEL